MNRTGQVFIISGPSGSGKDTLILSLLQNRKDIKLSISSVTRCPRSGEVDGQHYHFISRDEFVGMKEQGAFLEYNTYLGNYYGTPRKQVEQWIAQGKDVLLEIDVNGARSVRKALEDTVSIFIMPPSLQMLEHRLLSRCTEDDLTARQRLREALREIESAGEYDYIVVNDQLQEAALLVGQIIDVQKARTKNMINMVKGVLLDAQSVNW